MFGIGGGGFNIGSLVSTAALAGATGGTSVALQAALSTVMQTVGSQILQQVGQQLGLPQSVIDLAQAAFAGATGNPAGVASNLHEATQGVSDLFGATPYQAGEFHRASEDFVQKMSNMIIDGMKNENEKAASAGGVGNANGQSFLVRLGIALGSVLDQKMDRMMAISREIAGLGKIDQNNQSKLAGLTGEMQGIGQEYGLVSNALNNTQKAIGEGNKTLASKNG
ncbi:MAG TPA: hypothetical protein DIV82_12810 [Brevundimonas diminuta]|nr:hypothetical protein [Brevundimonas diminuta]